MGQSLAMRARSGQKTFGYRRAEILAAAANGIVLGVAAIAVVVEALGRLRSKPSVAGGPMLAVAVGGLVVNLIGSTGSSKPAGRLGAAQDSLEVLKVRGSKKRRDASNPCEGSKQKRETTRITHQTHEIVWTSRSRSIPRHPSDSAPRCRVGGTRRAQNFGLTHAWFPCLPMAEWRGTLWPREA
jgi:hypothetical protein